MRKFTCFAICSFFLLSGYGQTKNLAEKLGYPKEAKLLIIHADDAGFAHAADSAIISAFEKKVINSAAIMVTCPWFPEIAGYAKKHPELDWGIHLTLTSEWPGYKWGGVSSSTEIPSLLNKEGYLYASNADFLKNAKINEAEKEIRAQINKAQQAGINLSHLDSHMGNVLLSEDMLRMYQRVGKEYRLPVLLPINMFRIMNPKILAAIDSTGILVSNYIVAFNNTTPDKWKNFYNYSLQNLKQGLNELIFHLAFNGDEMKAVAGGIVEYGAAWRQQDYDYATGAAFKELLKKQGVYLVTWGMIKKAVYGK